MKNRIALWRTWCLCPLIAFLLPLSVNAKSASANELSLVIEDDTLLARGVSPGGAVALLGAARRLDNWTPIIVGDHAQPQDNGLDSEVRHRPGFAIPAQSLWVGVDTSTGELALATPGDTPPRTLSLPTGQLLTDGRGGLQGLALNAGLLHVMVVRPGIGSWIAVIGDGSATDGDDEANGLLTVMPSRLSPMGPSIGETVAPPRLFEPEDIIVLLDPRRLAVMITTFSDPAFSGEEL